MDKDTKNRIRFLEGLVPLTTRERLHRLNIETDEELRILAGLAPQVDNGLLLLLAIRAILVLRDEKAPQAATQSYS